MPLSDTDQTCLAFRLGIVPHAPAIYYAVPGGMVHGFNVRTPHSELAITAESRVETHVADPFIGLNLLTDDWDFYARSSTRQDYAEYLSATRLVPVSEEACQIAAAARRQSGVSAAAFLIALTRMLNRLLTYAPGATHVHTSIEQILNDRRGVCQDFAHLMLAVCRCQGIPARYVSGYVYTPADGPTTHAEQASHAWVEALMPDGAWHGFDATNNLLTNDRYVKVHYGRDYRDVAPTRGLYRGPLAHSLEIDVDVRKE